jgi:hypothetical protein
MAWACAPGSACWSALTYASYSRGLLICGFCAACATVYRTTAPAGMNTSNTATRNFFIRLAP